MDNILSEYEALYMKAQLLVFFCGFFACLSLVLAGLLFNKEKPSRQIDDITVRKWMRRYEGGLEP